MPSRVPAIAPMIKISTDSQLHNPPSSTPEPSDTPHPTDTPIPGSGEFPTTGVLDNFNRANGGLGGNWNIQSGSPTINNDQMNLLSNSDSITFWKTAFGANQEAYVTLPALDSSSTEVDLILNATLLRSSLDLL